MNCWDIKHDVLASEVQVQVAAVAIHAANQRASIQASFGRTTADGLLLHDGLFQHPYINIAHVQNLTGKGFPAANRLVTQMVDAGILREITGRSRNRVYLPESYFKMFDDSEV